MKKLAIIAVALITLAAFSGDYKVKAANIQPQNAARVERLAEKTEEESEKSADEFIGETVDELLNGLDFSGLDEEFSGFEFFQGAGSAKNRIAELISGNYKINLGDLLQEILKLFFGGVRGLILELSLVIAVALITALTKSLAPRDSKGVNGVAFFVCFVVVVGIVGTRFGLIYKECADTALTLERQLEAVFPILMTLMTAGGANVSAAVFQPQVAFLLKGMGLVVKNVLLPIILLLFVFGAVGKMSDKIKVGKTSDFLKSTFKWITGLTAVIFNFLVTVQGITTSVYDGVSVKALKYALGNSVPLVGNLVNSGFDVVLASTILIKNAVGSFALLAVLYVLISPILKIAVFSVFLRLCAAISEPIGDERICGFLSSVADVSGYLIAALTLFAASYVIMLLLIICSLGGAI